MKKILSKIPKTPEFAIGLLLLFFVNQFVWSKEHWQTGVLSTDGRGYYAYLPAFIIFQDLTYEKSNQAVEEQFGHKMSHHCILKDENGKTFNKTFPGVALMQLPFFLLSIAFSWLFGYSINGFSEPFLIGVQLSAICAALLGFYAIRKTLVLINLSYKSSLFIGFLILFGTNVFYYATAVPSLGHIYSFALMAWIIYTTKKMSIEFNTKYLYLLVVFISLLILIRPTNAVIVIVLPFVMGSKQSVLNVIEYLKKHKTVIFKTILVGMTVLSILPLLWYVQTGKPFVWSYTGEGFYWLHPLPHKVLFSFRNGLFIWTPIAFVSLFGFYYAYKKMVDKWLVIFALAYFLINLYVISAWWTHYYGGGFGHRVYVEHQVFTALMLGYLMLYIRVQLIKVFIGLCILLTSLNVAQAVQMNKGILPQDYVNWEMYKLLFLKFDDEWKGECKATLDCRQFGTIIHIDYLRPVNENIEPQVDFDETREFGADIQFNTKDVNPKAHLFVEYFYDKIRNNDDTFNNVYFVVDGVNDKGETIFYEAHELYQIRSEALNEWKSLEISLQLSNVNIVSYKMYIWNQGRHSFSVKNSEVRIYQILP